MLPDEDDDWRSEKGMKRPFPMRDLIFVNLMVRLLADDNTRFAAGETVCNQIARTCN